MAKVKPSCNMSDKKVLLLEYNKINSFLLHIGDAKMLSVENQLHPLIFTVSFRH